MFCITLHNLRSEAQRRVLPLLVTLRNSSFSSDVNDAQKICASEFSPNHLESTVSCTVNCLVVLWIVHGLVHAYFVHRAILA
jgi:dynactin complex subunit